MSPNFSTSKNIDKIKIDLSSENPSTSKDSQREITKSISIDVNPLGVQSKSSEVKENVNEFKINSLSIYLRPLGIFNTNLEIFRHKFKPY
jgi:hypothetical protein